MKLVYQSHRSDLDIEQDIQVSRFEDGTAMIKQWDGTGKMMHCIIVPPYALQRFLAAMLKPNSETNISMLTTGEE